jgi:hypothetical protein
MQFWHNKYFKKTFVKTRQNKNLTQSRHSKQDELFLYYRIIKGM